MERFQIYLKQNSVDTLDEVARLIGVSRSHLIREAIDGAVDRIGNILATIAPIEKSKYQNLNSLIGITKTKNNTTLSENVDDIYYK